MNAFCDRVIMSMCHHVIINVCTGVLAASKCGSRPLSAEAFEPTPKLGETHVIMHVLTRKEEGRVKENQVHPDPQRQRDMHVTNMITCDHMHARSCDHTTSVIM